MVVRSRREPRRAGRVLGGARTDDPEIAIERDRNASERVDVLQVLICLVFTSADVDADELVGNTKLLRDNRNATRAGGEADTVDFDDHESGWRSR